MIPSENICNDYRAIHSLIGLGLINQILPSNAVKASLVVANAVGISSANSF